MTYCFYIDKDLKIYGFDLSFPTKYKQQVAQWEEEIFRFGDEFKKTDLSKYLKPYHKERFQGSIYYIKFSRLKGMSKDKRAK